MCSFKGIRGCFAILSLIALVTLLESTETEAAEVGLSKGTLNAQPSGGISYEMPIVVSPGTAGMQPKLSFQYNSGGRNGALGVGWSIGGISVITRAPKTRAQDNGEIHGVDMTMDDRYSMDGQRLILVSHPPYGGNDAEYRTEINSFTRIVSKGTTALGPLTFEAETKAGLKYTFGGPNNASYIPNPATGAVLTWLISKIEDQAGNYMTFSYTSEGNISQVEYTMNPAGLSSYASVVFSYEQRGDSALGYIVGSQIPMNERLIRVVSYSPAQEGNSGQQLVRRYDLDYEYSSTTGKSRLRSITEKATGPDGVSIVEYPPTQFTFDNDPGSLDFDFDVVQSGESVSGYHWAQGDFDGDGIVDAARMAGNDTSGRIHVYHANGSQLDEFCNQETGQPVKDSDSLHQGDFNGDGKLDLLRVHANGANELTFTLFRNNPQSGNLQFTRENDLILANQEQAFSPTNVYMAMDVNGDSKIDIVRINGPSSNGSTRDLVISVFLNDPNGNAPGTFTRLGAYPGISTDDARKTDRWLAGDVDGDGLPDLIKIRKSSDSNNPLQIVDVYLNRIPQTGFYVLTSGIPADQYSGGSGSGHFFNHEDHSDVIEDAGYQWAVGDFNGDGLTDLIRVPRNNNNQDDAMDAYVFLSLGKVVNGRGFATPQNWTNDGLTVSRAPKDGLQCGDYNGDGRSDLVLIRELNCPSTEPDEGGGSGLGSGEGELVECAYQWRRTEYLSDGKAFFAAIEDPIEVSVSGSDPKFKAFLAADFNGDGKEDIIRPFNITIGRDVEPYVQVFMSHAGFQDMLRQVTDGMGVATSIEYQPLTNPSVFVKSTNAVYPAIDLITPMPVVSKMIYDDGRGSAGSSTYSISYVYSGLKADPLRGMQGFESIEAIDSREVDNPIPNASPSEVPSTDWKLHTQTWFLQGYPFTGLTKRTRTFLAGPNSASITLSNATTFYLEQDAQPAGVHFPYASNSRVRAWDLTGALTNDTETIVESMDAYGNALRTIVKTKDFSTGDYFVKTTQSDFNIALSTWRIGQVWRSTVTHQAPHRDDIIRTSTFAYSQANGQVSTESIESAQENPEPDEQNTYYEFDAFGNIRLATVSASNVPARPTETQYEGRGRFVHITTNALGQSETKEYDERFGTAISVTGPNNLTEYAAYDGFGRQILSQRIDGTQTATFYGWIENSPPDAPANAKYFVRVTPQDGPVSHTYFDRLGREIRKRTLNANNQAVLVDTSYDQRGRKKTVTRPYFSGQTPFVATTTYDALDRVVQVKVPSVNEEGGAVDAITTTNYNGLVTTMVNPKLQSTTTTKDTAGHVIEVRDALNGTITYHYDAVGQLYETIDAAGHTTTITYNRRGWKTSVNDPDLGNWSYSYYATGELKSQTDANNQTVQFLYDDLGRMTRRDEPDGGFTEWTYDTAHGAGIGKLASVQFTPPHGSNLAPYSNSIDYDGLGRPITQRTTIHGAEYVTSTDYDQYSRPELLTYPSDFQVRQVYSPNGYLTKVTSPNQLTKYWEAQQYDADGQVTREKYGNNIVTDRVYFARNGLLNTISSPVQNLEYHFDVLGNLAKRTDHYQSNLDEVFVYDALNRLRRWQVGQQQEKTISYDVVNGSGASLGNIAVKSDVGTYTYDLQHPHAVSSINNDGNATYDANGNMTDGFGRHLTWTWFNMPQLIERTANTPGSSYFEYDADHNRVWQVASVAGKSTVETTYVGGFYERVFDGETIKRKHYINTPVGRVAVYTLTYTIADITDTPDIKYFHRDHLGSVDVITDQDGVSIEKDSFDAWGARRNAIGWQGAPPSGFHSVVTRGYTDHEQLDVVGLIHMNGRVYDPIIGRFLSADPFVQAPMVTQNFNRYSYVVNNPLSLSDPTGFNIFGDFFNWLTNALGATGAQVVVGVAAIAVGIATAGAFSAAFAAILPAVTLTTETGLTLAGAIVGGAGFGFGAGFSSTIMTGGSLGQAFQAGAVGALIGGISGGIAHGLGGLNPNGDFFSLGHLEQSVGHAVLGGAASEVQGDNWQSGALAGGLAAFFGPVINKFPLEAERVAASAVVGGTAAELGGGKFANGAVTAAFLRLYNEESARRLAPRDRRLRGIGPKPPASGIGSPSDPYPVSSDDVTTELDKAYPRASEIGKSNWLYLLSPSARYAYLMAKMITFDSNFYHEACYQLDMPGYRGVWSGFEINYIAVGEGFAAAGFSPAGMQNWISGWNYQYSDVMVAGKLQWARLGYDYYNARSH